MTTSFSSSLREDLGSEVGFVQQQRQQQTELNESGQDARSDLYLQ